MVLDDVIHFSTQWTITHLTKRVSAGTLLTVKQKDLCVYQIQHQPIKYCSKNLYILEIFTHHVFKWSMSHVPCPLDYSNFLSLFYKIWENNLIIPFISLLFCFSTTSTEVLFQYNQKSHVWMDYVLQEMRM